MQPQAGRLTQVPQRLLAGRCRHDPIALQLKQCAQRVTLKRIVFDQQDYRRRRLVGHALRQKRPLRRAVAQCDHQSEHRSLAGHGPYFHRVAKKLCETLYDVQPQPQTGPAGVRPVYPIELLENGVELVRRNADAGIPHLDPQRVAPMPAPYENLTMIGILDSVRQQIAEHACEQSAITADD